MGKALRWDIPGADRWQTGAGTGRVSSAMSSSLSRAARRILAACCRARNEDEGSRRRGGSSPASSTRRSVRTTPSWKAARRRVLEADFMLRRCGGWVSTTTTASRSASDESRPHRRTIGRQLATAAADVQTSARQRKRVAELIDSNLGVRPSLRSASPWQRWRGKHHRAPATGTAPQNRPPDHLTSRPQHLVQRLNNTARKWWTQDTRRGILQLINRDFKRDSPRFRGV